MNLTIQFRKSFIQSAGSKKVISFNYYWSYDDQNGWSVDQHKIIMQFCTPGNPLDCFYLFGHTRAISQVIPDLDFFELCLGCGTSFDMMCFETILRGSGTGSVRHKLNEAFIHQINATDYYFPLQCLPTFLVLLRSKSGIYRNSQRLGLVV